MSTSKDLIKAIKQKGKNIEAEMSFFDHLEVLRWHIIRSVIAIVVFAMLSFTFYDFVFEDIIMGPKNLDFWTYRMMCKLGDLTHLSGLCVERIPFNLINTEMAGQFMLKINSCLLMALAMGFPYLIFEIWLFVRPALTNFERQSAQGFVLYASMLFVTGALFGYYIVVPLSINFLSNVSLSGEITNQITSNDRGALRDSVELYEIHLQDSWHYLKSETYTWPRIMNGDVASRNSSRALRTRLSEIDTSESLRNISS